MKIEAGKFYRDRSGKRFGPMKIASLLTDPPTLFAHEAGERNTKRWTLEGVFVSGLRVTEYDLIAEWADGVAAPDPVSHPSHYTSHPSGTECIQITEHMNFNRGNAVKYIWRAGEKGDEVQDLEKAVWYLQREIARIKK